MAAPSTATSPAAKGFPLEQDERSQHELLTLPSGDSKGVSTYGVSVEEGQWLSRLPLFTDLGAVCLVCFLMLLDTSIVVTAIPQITSDFHSLQDVEWYGSAYQLARWAYWMDFNWKMTDIEASAAFLPLTGKLYTTFTSKVSRRIPIYHTQETDFVLQWTFLVFFAIFEVGSLLCGVATSSKFLIVGRAIAGLGTSGISNGAFTIIAQCVPMTRRPGISQIRIDGDHD